MLQHGESKAGQDRYDQGRKSRKRYGISEDARVLVNVVCKYQQVWSRRGSVVVAEKTKNAQGSGKHRGSMMCSKGMEGQNKTPNAKGDISNQKKRRKIAVVTFA